MATYEQKRQNALRLLRSAIAFTRQSREYDKEYTGRLQQAAKRLEEGSFIVVVAGEFRRGKSSLLNAFLDVPQGQELFPVDIHITTNLATTVKYGPHEHILILLAEEHTDGVKPLAITRRDIRQYVTENGNPDNKREARLMQIELPHEQLKLGLMLVDTPGVGGLYERHTDVTYQFLPNADAVLFVSDVLTPLTDTELKFIKERILPHTEYLIFVLTKKDQIIDYTPVLETNRQKLAATLQRPAEDITIVPVSSKLKRSYLSDHDQDDLNESNFLELEALLWQFVGANRGRVLIARALEIANRVIGEIHRPLQVEFDAYQEQNRQKLDALEGSLKGAQQVLVHLQAENAQWQSDLQYGLNTISSDAQYELERGFADIRYKARGYITESVLQNPESVLSPVHGNINNLLNALDRSVGSQAAQLKRTIERSTGLALNPFAPEGLYRRSKPLSADRLKAIPLRTIEKQSFMEDVNDGFRETSVIRAGVGFIGSLFHIGGLIIAGIKAAIGLFGANRASKRKMQQVKQRDRHEIEAQLMSIIAEQQHELAHHLNGNMRNLAQAMREDLLRQIRQELASRDRALQSFLAARQRTSAEGEARMRILRGPLDQLERLRIGIEAALQDVLNQDDDPPIMKRQQQAEAANAQPSSEDTGRWADA